MKKLLFLIIVVLLAGVWFGINIARDKPLLSNPFEEKSLRDKAKDTAKDLYQESKEAIKKSLD
ncbi:MAG: hypothetical protein CVV05_18215 [Gammaproteobacteria bacterium HGW-Gammaproteobacteria-1]|jgi:hypothetical protein|nr:MAG: hypothetical protein CVV05_18215 [Gammaproteobacteria bacterium HGW-Gammaproteobacteria-1]